MTYRPFKIKKKSGGFRELCAPDKELKKYQRSKLKGLEKEFYRECPKSLRKTFTGFLKGTSVIKAAEQHVGFEGTLMMDLSAFFDTVHISMFKERLQDPLFFRTDTQYCAQGFVTSPILANIAIIPAVKRINKYLTDTFGPNSFAFTIYADDISISLNYDSYPEFVEVSNVVTNIVISEGFQVNQKKTRIKYAKHGFRRILGVNVGDTGTRTTRSTMRKLRAATHQAKRASKGGLTAWKNHCTTGDLA